jgi:hypothetical protein
MRLAKEKKGEMNADSFALFAQGKRAPNSMNMTNEI